MVSLTRGTKIFTRKDYYSCARVVQDLRAFATIFNSSKPSSRGCHWLGGGPVLHVTPGPGDITSSENPVIDRCGPFHQARIFDDLGPNPVKTTCPCWLHVPSDMTVSRVFLRFNKSNDRKIVTTSYRLICLQESTISVISSKSDYTSE